MTRFEYTVVTSSLHDRESIERITAPVRAALEVLGGQAITWSWCAAITEAGSSGGGGWRVAFGDQ